MTRIDRREHHMRQISEKVTLASGPLPTGAQSHRVPDHGEDRLPYTNPKDRYHISSAQKYPLNVGQFLRDNRGDPALKVGAFPAVNGG